MEMLKSVLREPGFAVLVGMALVFLLLTWATRPKRERPRPWKGRPRLVDDRPDTSEKRPRESDTQRKE